MPGTCTDTMDLLSFTCQKPFLCVFSNASQVTFQEK
ncbi:hypothetical protein T06_11730 [Trichinella sp. T6]|nr:hypothetical protein T06_11730 [Trichinella sp. T6]